MKLINRFLSMSETSWQITIKTLILSCAMLFCAFLLLMSTGDLTADNYSTYLLIKELYTLPQALLLLSCLAAVIIEEHNISKN